MSPTRVVVTGLGATTPLGGDVPSTWEGLLAGRSGVSRIEEAWADDLPCKIAAKAAVDPGTVLDRVEARRLDRVSQLAVIAATEASMPPSRRARPATRRCPWPWTRSDSVGPTW
jgi:3-oxoacyl-[acyl-carrier-protein] synthase II